MDLMNSVCREHFKMCRTVRRFNTAFGLLLTCSVICRALVMLSECYIIHRNSIKVLLGNILNGQILTTEATVLLEAIDVVIIISACAKIPDMVSINKHC